MFSKSCSEHIGCSRESVVVSSVRTLSSWDRTPYTPKDIVVHLPELTGETVLVSIATRDINAEIGVFITPKYCGTSCCEFGRPSRPLSDRYSRRLRAGAGTLGRSMPVQGTAGEGDTVDHWRASLILPLGLATATPATPGLKLKPRITRRTRRSRRHPYCLGV
jgi:hypothetical protein